MKTLSLIARILLGLIYFIFGFNFFLNFIPMKHPPMGKEGDASLQGLIGSGYFFQFLKTVEILGRLFLLINRYTTFFLLMLLPVTVNIFLFHTILAPSGVPIAVGMLILNVFLCISYFKYYASVFTARPEILGPDKT